MNENKNKNDFIEVKIGGTVIEKIPKLNMDLLAEGFLILPYGVQSVYTMPLEKMIGNKDLINEIIDHHLMMIF